MDYYYIYNTNVPLNFLYVTVHQAVAKKSIIYTYIYIYLIASPLLKTQGCPSSLTYYGNKMIKTIKTIRVTMSEYQMHIIIIAIIVVIVIIRPCPIKHLSQEGDHKLQMEERGKMF
jgi:hypothetical protein